MNLEPRLREMDLDALRHFDTCTISNQIETFRGDSATRGFADSRVRCLFEDFPPVVGYAATARLRTRGHSGCSLPAPAKRYRVLV
jgi:4-hydroxy-4-methyl-2-oxoglutarate aldolase